MKVYLIGVGPGDPELLTRKAYSIIKRAGICIYAGSLISKEIINLLPKKCKKYDSSKMTLEDIEKVYIYAKKRKRNVARLQSGDLSIYSSGSEQMELFEKHNIRCEWVPGISAFQAASSRIQKEFTLPGITQTIILTRVSGRTKVPKRESLSSLAKHKATIAIYLSVQKSEEIQKVVSKYYGKDCPCAICVNLTRKNENIYFDKISNLSSIVKKNKITKTAILIVGYALAKKGKRSKLYDPGFTHEYRKKT